MRNTFSIIAIVGITIAVLSIIGGLLLSVFFLQETHPLYFEDSYGNPVDGDVYLNGEHLGKTIKGKVFIKEFTTGEVKIRTYKNGQEYENYFDIEPSDSDYELTFEVDFSEEFNSNPITTDEYSSYMDAIEISNNELRLESTNAASECFSGDKECQLISIYEHVLQNYKYFGDARDDEHIQTPSETKQYKGGDCEDLSILLNSLLENIGIETWMVFTEDHAYSLACDIDPEILYNYTISLFYGNELVENSTQEIDLEPGEAWYYGGGETFEGNILSLYGQINSDKPIIIFAVEEEKEFQAFMDDEEYYVIDGTYYEDIKRKSFEYVVPDYGGFVIYNPNYQSVSVDLSLEAFITYLGIDPEDIEITTYEVDNKICVPLDPSAGEMSYAGYEAEDNQEKTFVNTITREEYGST
jgi:hypothetical protein